MTEKTIVWVHGDCLNPLNPALEHAPNAPSIFVWDDELLEEWSISFKRIVFMYECLLELPVVIRRGNVAEQVAQFARENDAIQILTTTSPSPRFQIICHSILSLMPADARLDVLPVEAFVDLDSERLDLKRWSRYWKSVKHVALQPTRKPKSR